MAATIAAVLCLYIFSALSHIVSPDTIRASLGRAAADGQLNPWVNVDNDMFTECAIMDMAAQRDPDIVRDLVSAPFLLSAGGHPCEVLQKHLAGVPLGSEPPVIKYHYGSRYLFALLSGVMDVATIRQWLFVLSIVAPLALAGAILTTGASRYLVLLPLPVMMVLGFSVGTLGPNIAHAPGFVVPTMMLAALVTLRRWLEPRPRRYAAYAVLAVVTTYFDTLSGPLPFFLFATIVINHILFVDGDERNHWWTEGLWVVAVFVGAVGVTLGIRLTAAAIILWDNPLPEFFRSLLNRMSSDNGGGQRITIEMIADRLLANHGVHFNGAEHIAALFYVSAAIAWAIALWETVVYRRPWRTVAALAGASLVIIAWFLLLPNHTYVHYQFMGRLAVAPALAGFIALASLRSKSAALLPATMLATVAILMLVHHVWAVRIGMAVELLPAVPVDVVACSNDLPLVADAKPDRIFALEIFGPLWTPVRVTAITISRHSPGGVSSTNAGSFGLTVMSEDGSLLSNKDTRAIDISIRGRNRVLLAICDDGADTAASTFSVDVVLADGMVITTAGRRR